MCNKQVKQPKVFSVHDVIGRAITIQTFRNKNGQFLRWINKGDGTFCLIDNKHKKIVTETAINLYRDIKIVVFNQKIIAKRESKNDSLKPVNIPLNGR